jgi:hypothetical protein
LKQRSFSSGMVRQEKPCMSSWMKVPVMLIACSTCRRLSGVDGNVGRRSLGLQTCGPQRKRTQIGLVRAQRSATIHPSLVKSVIPVQATSACRQGAVRGVRGQHAGKDRHRNLGDPYGWSHLQRAVRMHKAARPIGKSDAFIVAMKRVTTVEPRDATTGQQPCLEGVPLG